MTFQTPRWGTCGGNCEPGEIHIFGAEAERKQQIIPQPEFWADAEGGSLSESHARVSTEKLEGN